MVHIKKYINLSRDHVAKQIFNGAYTMTHVDLKRHDDGEMLDGYYDMISFQVLFEQSIKISDVHVTYTKATGDAGHKCEAF